MRLPNPLGTVPFALSRVYGWADLVRAARDSTVLRLIVDHERTGLVTREQVLCTAVMYLASAQIRALDEAIERASLTLPAPLILPRDPDEPKEN